MSMAINVSRAEVLAQVRDLAAADWHVDPVMVTESARIADLPEVDSVKQIRMTAKMEQKYGIAIIDENTLPAATIGEFVDQVLAALHRG